MQESSNKNAEIMNEVIDKLVGEILKSYKVDNDFLREFILKHIQGNRELISIIEKDNDFKKIARTRVYKDFANNMKRKVYNDLRRYFQSSCDTDKIINNINDVQKDTDEGRDFFKKLLQQHVSTRERIEELDNFYDPVISYILSSKSILDVGCGINPLMVPFNSSDSKVEKYIAVDKDKKSIKIVDEYSKWLGNAKLEGINWDIKEGWDKLYNITGIKEYDIALIMKVITVVKRQESELLSILRDTPAKYLLITGSKTSMTKKCSIEKREKNDVIRFIEDNAWLKVLEFDRKEEFGWLVRKG